MFKVSCHLIITWYAQFIFAGKFSCDSAILLGSLEACACYEFYGECSLVFFFWFFSFLKTNNFNICLTMGRTRAAGDAGEDNTCDISNSGGASFSGSLTDFGFTERTVKL